MDKRFTEQPNVARENAPYERYKYNKSKVVAWTALLIIGNHRIHNIDGRKLAANSRILGRESEAIQSTLQVLP